MSETGLTGTESGVQSAGDQSPKAATAKCVVLKDPPQEGQRIVDYRRYFHGAVVVRVGLRAEKGGEEGDKGKNVGNAAGVLVVLEAAPEGGDVVCRGAPGGEEAFEARGQDGLLVGWNGEGMAESVHNDIRVSDALGRLLVLHIAESQTESVCEAVPVVLRAAGRAGRACADWTSAVEARARGVRRGLGREDGVVDPDDRVPGVWSALGCRPRLTAGQDR